MATSAAIDVGPIRPPTPAHPAHQPQDGLWMSDYLKEHEAERQRRAGLLYGASARPGEPVRHRGYGSQPELRDRHPGRGGDRPRGQDAEVLAGESLRSVAGT